MIVGNCIGGFNELMRQHDVLRERGPDRVSPTFLANVLVDSASGQIAIELSYRIPNFHSRLGLRRHSHTDRRDPRADAGRGNANTNIASDRRGLPSAR